MSKKAITNDNPSVRSAPEREFTPEQRLGLLSASVPLLRSLRKRILAYSTLWIAAGMLLLLLSLPAFLDSSRYIALTLLIYGGSLIAFALFRVLESRSLAALIEVGRSGLRRNIWLFFNFIVFAAALAVCLLTVSGGGDRTLNHWIALPSSVFVMIVSLSPALEWLFVHRVIRNSRGLLEDFCKSLRVRYTDPEEMTTLFAIVNTVYLIEKLGRKGILRQSTSDAVKNELIGIMDGPHSGDTANAKEGAKPSGYLPEPGAPAIDTTAVTVSDKPW
ncbi:MAG: hypothetical protein K6F50_00500 [Kiritimatiellae bacterium]|nr:hypothetical protein [Kiritimatiellia bacterium]